MFYHTLKAYFGKHAACKISGAIINYSVESMGTLKSLQPATPDMNNKTV